MDWESVKRLIRLPAGPKALLPPQSPHNSGRKTLVLDLDETLVHASFEVNNRPSRCPSPSLKQDDTGSDFSVSVRIGRKLYAAHVRKRPFVEEFLKRMGELYEVVVFTASLKKAHPPSIAFEWFFLWGV